MTIRKEAAEQFVPLLRAGCIPSNLIAPAKCNRAMTDRAGVRSCAPAAAGALCTSGTQRMPPKRCAYKISARNFMARIDCDIHPAVGGTRTTLLPYLSDHWKEQVVSRAIDGLDLTSYPPSMPLAGRADWRPANGAKPGSDLAMVQKGAFEQLGASHAILNVLYGAQAVFDPYMAADFCRAINDWIATEWLSRDARLRASIVVPMQDPDLAVEEIERRAGDHRFVSIL